MIRRITIIFIILTGMFVIPAVLGAENKVARGGTIYIGEADLDLSDCNIRNGDEIAWWDSGNPEGTPTARARVDDIRRFTVDPQTFRGHTGTWYGLVSKKMVFAVEEPFLQFDIMENGIDTEPESIKRGNLVSFKISTNLADLSKRAGSSGATVSINMSGPNETEYHKLTSKRTDDFNLDKVFVYTSPYDTGVVWDTSDEEKFPDGEYTFSASTNVNRINEIFPESGISYTDKKTYTLGKTEVKPGAKETEKPDKSSKKKSDVSAESSPSPTPTQTPDDEEKSDKKSVKNNTKKEDSTEPTGEATPEEKSGGTSGKKKTTATPTVTSTPEETAEITETPTPEPTTQEPTPVVTPHATRAPLPHPPGPGAAASPTQASPLPAGIIIAALASAGALLSIRRRH